MNAKEYKPTHGGYPGVVPAGVSPVKQLLIDARAVIADPTKWVKGAMARHYDGFILPANDPRASCFCSLGAVHRASNADMASELSDDAKHAIRLLDEQADYIYDSDVDAGPGCKTADFNDHRNTTHADVLRLFDTAIKAAP